MPETHSVTTRAAAAPFAPRLLTILSAGAVVLVTLALYWPARDAGFVGDDFMILHRLRGLAGLADALRFFRGEFFDYYRPLGFLSHALDWTIAGPDPRQFHLTNLLLHGTNTVLVLLIARALAVRGESPVSHRMQPGFHHGLLPPASVAGLVAALLFALHASNHEAVVWVSARFDLMATFWSLAAVWWMVSGAPGSRWGPAILFLPALLSKESAVALPIGAAAWAVFCLRSTTRDTIARLAPWLLVLVAYALLRQVAGGVPATGGAGRLPKLLVFATTLGILVVCADERWLRLRGWLRSHGRLAGALVVSLVLTMVVVSALAGGSAGTIAGEKLAVAGFALVYLVAPVTEVGAAGAYLQPLDALYWRIALAGLPLAALVLWALRRPLLGDARFWFLAALFLATLLPISALTEGRRYLYLPSAVVSVALGIGIAQLRGRWRVLALSGAAVVVAISSVRIADKVQDWIWAGNMTAEGVRLADEALAPACNAGHVVFLTSPVGVGGVYTHFYYETFEPVRGCIPETFQIVARLLRADTDVDARWAGPDRIVLTVPDYRGNLVLSRDFRHFNLPLRDSRTRALTTPLGELRAVTVGSSQRLTLTLAPAAHSEETVFLFYSRGRMHRLPAFVPREPRQSR